MAWMKGLPSSRATARSNTWAATIVLGEQEVGGAQVEQFLAGQPGIEAGGDLQHLARLVGLAAPQQGVAEPGVDCARAACPCPPGRPAGSPASPRAEPRWTRPSDTWAAGLNSSIATAFVPRSARRKCPRDRASSRMVGDQVGHARGRRRPAPSWVESMARSKALRALEVACGSAATAVATAQREIIGLKARPRPRRQSRLLAVGHAHGETNRHVARDIVAHGDQLAGVVSY